MSTRSMMLGMSKPHNQANCKPTGPAGVALPMTGEPRLQPKRQNRMQSQKISVVTNCRPQDYRTSEAYIADMVKRLTDERENRRDDEWESASSRTPFTDEVLNEKYPDEFTTPTIPFYDGMKDPKPHLYKYSWYMDGANTSEAIFYISFPIFLEGVASMWFTRLPPRFISTFDLLTIRFLDQFRLHTTLPKMSCLYRDCAKDASNR